MPLLVSNPFGVPASTSQRWVDALATELSDKVQKIGEENLADLQAADLFDPAAIGRVITLCILTPSISAVTSFLLFRFFPIYQ